MNTRLKNQGTHVVLARPADIKDLAELDYLVWGDKCPEPTGIIQFWNNQERLHHKTPCLGVSPSHTQPFCSLPRFLSTNEFKNRNEAAWVRIMKYGFVLTVWESGFLAGSAAVVLFRYGGNVHGRVHKVSVHPKHRLSGIGTALMRTTVRLADQHSLSLSVSANQDNQAALKLYKKAGFNVLNEKDLSQHTSLLSESGINIEFSFYDKKFQLLRPAAPVRAKLKSEETFDLVCKNALER